MDRSQGVNSFFEGDPRLCSSSCKFILDKDTSGVVTDAVLSQAQDGTERVFTYSCWKDVHYLKIHCGALQWLVLLRDLKEQLLG